MADITKCSGEGCAARKYCYRYLAPTDWQLQAMFVNVPGKDKYCKYYWKLSRKAAKVLKQLYVKQSEKE